MDGGVFIKGAVVKRCAHALVLKFIVGIRAIDIEPKMGRFTAHLSHDSPSADGYPLASGARALGHTRRMNGPGPASLSAREVRVLHLEDSELDHELAMAHLRRGGLRVAATRVESRSEFEAALAQHWDVILSDYNLPGFSGVLALQIVRDSGRDSGRVLPFILVSGEIGEETAVDAMRNGASDYILKHNLARLAPAMERAIDAGETQRARLAADRELQVSRSRLSELAQHLQTSVEMERTAIAREIHDDVGGSLTALKFDLDWIRRHSSSAEVQLRVTSALETVTHAIEASQRVMHNLRPAILEQGLVPALQWMAQRFARRTGIECAFSSSANISHESLALPAGVPLVAYRTAQEALTNVSKHAQAQRVDIELSHSAGVLLLEISDNGRGVSPQDLAKARSFGIRGLHERASTVGGWIDLTSSAGGTTLILSVPVLPGARPEVGAAAAADRTHDPSTWGAM